MKFFKKAVNFFYESREWYEILYKSLILLLIPYAWLWLCSILFQGILKWLFMSGFTLISTLILFFAALVCIEIIIRAFVKKKRKTKIIKVTGTDPAQTKKETAEEAKEKEEIKTDAADEKTEE